MNIQEATHKVLSGLTPLECKILRMRFGIDLNAAQTLEEIGKQFDITPAGVDEIVNIALRKLRHPAHSIGIEP